MIKPPHAETGDCKCHIVESSSILVFRDFQHNSQLVKLKFKQQFASSTVLNKQECSNVLLVLNIH